MHLCLFKIPPVIQGGWEPAEFGFYWSLFSILGSFFATATLLFGLLVQNFAKLLCEKAGNPK